VNVKLSGPNGVVDYAMTRANVADAAIVVTPVPVSTRRGRPLTNVRVATFTDGDPGGVVPDYTATVDWGNGLIVPGVLTADATVAGQFDVTASKPTVYALPGTATFTVRVSDGGSAAQAANSWAKVASLAVGGSAAAVGARGRIYAFGSSLGPGKVFAYHPKANTWHAVASLLTPRYGVAAVAGPDGRIYAIGGESSVIDASAEVDAYDPRTNAWTKVAPLPTARFKPAAAVGPDGRIYAIGGRDAALKPTTEVDAYDAATNTWTRVAPLNHDRFYLGAAVGPDGRIYAIGGDSFSVPGGVRMDVEAYDPETNLWTTASPIPQRREDLGAAMGPDGRIYVVSGTVAGTSLTTEVDAYDPRLNAWTPVDSIPKPAPTGNDVVTGSDGRIYALGQGIDYAYAAVPPSGASATGKVKIVP
jgi:hypothetical protein